MTSPKLRFWAKLISRGRYDDYDNVPPIPLLQEDSSGNKKSSLSDALVDVNMYNTLIASSILIVNVQIVLVITTMLYPFFIIVSS